ncbi:hypothetical protein CPB83DRAFT_833008 [Crepidotus variabilis]|uniref:Uncharacterized protein n=1 Tax=Crepidotus variabilis TaxID=179855 RepID=A0A9P6JTY8_9AGAR|nr:hypothetical protein CPB83DRAFT_833008 [Crepidotus variabilis]
MASSTSTTARQPTRGQPLVRQNSSFLGTIKNIVTAPLSWFGHQDGDATGAKRRRDVVQQPTERVLANGSGTTGSRDVDDEEMGDSLRRSKRMRLNTPPGRTVNAEGYNDPPVSAFGRTQTNSIRRASLVPRASSAVLPSSRNSRATLSPSRRHHHQAPSQIKRTMSIDPPHVVSRRNVSNSSSNWSNVGMDMDNAMDTGRDTSMPPSPRPSFRMRASMTPQPQHVPARHISEPPPLNALISNPQFLHPPTQAQERAQTPTLGSLVDARASRSPVRQNHSSLLFSKTSHEEKDAPAEKALQQLDIYKTPLLPTRMRSSNGDSITGKVLPDMFKSRRSSRLVLMPDDGERGRKKHKSSVNETKPYAGEGGMKKLLARAKLEADKEEDPLSSTSGEIKESFLAPPPAAVPPPPPPGSDWFTTAVSGAPSSTAGSSLRVGRQKTSRNHIQRPSKSRFSAAEEDEGDDAMEDDESTKERKMLEEAAKKVPVFQIPAGFSFAKDAPAPITPPAELEKAKEPPISSLPFSFTKPVSTSSPSPTPSASVPTLPSVPVQPKQALFGTAPLPPKKTDSGVPNFFANSQKIKESPIPTPPVLNFTPPASSSPTPSLFGAPSTTPAPAKDSENPLWDGEKNKASEAKPSPALFGGSFPPVSRPSENTAPASTPFSFGKPADVSAAPATTPASPFPSIIPAAEKPSITLTAATPSPFSFSKTEDKPVVAPPTPTPFSLSKPAEIIPTANSSAPPSMPFSFAKQAKVPIASSSGSSTPFSFGGSEPKKPEVEPLAPKPLFGVGAPNPLFGEASQAPLTFGDSSKTTSPLHVPAVAPPQSTPSPLGFNFGSSAPAPAEAPKPAFSFGTGSATSSPAAEPPKSLFSGGGFSFGQPVVPEKPKEASPAPFSFGTPTTPVVEAKAFSFGQTTTPVTPAVVAPTSIGFSFSGGGGSASTDVSNKPAFMFGNSAPAAQPVRPTTPPKGQDQEFRMEESPMQMNGNKGMDSGQFSFGNGPSLNGGSGFSGGVPAPSSGPSPFSFNTSSTSNPFGAKKPEEAKPFGFSAPPQAPPINTSFSFGQSKDETRPASASAFSFGQTPANTPTAAPGFSFGTPAPAANPFGQAAVGSVPSSPSTFNQPFGFGAQTPTAAPSNPFGFGSQPASPAGGNVVLPPAAISTSFSNGGGFGQMQAPSSPFTAPQQIAPSTSGGSLFTIGAAPVAPPSGQRAIKKMPRRGAVKR